MSSQSKDNIGWCTLLMNKHSFFAILIAFLGTFNIMYYKVFMVLVLTSEDEEMGYGLEEETAGYLISIPAFTYLTGCLLLPYTCEHSPRKFLFALACFGFAICNFFLGPS
jgi:predicted MFS family arabinose efflux permease